MHQPCLTDEARRQVLASLGLTSSQDLFSSIPPRFRRNADFRLALGGTALPDESTEAELIKYFSQLAERNRAPRLHFCGNGTYDEALPIAALSAAERLRYDAGDVALRARLASALAERLAALAGATAASLSFGDRFDAVASALELTLAARPRLARRVWVLGSAPDAPAIRALARRRGWEVETFPVDAATGGVDEAVLRRRVSDESLPTPAVAVAGFPNAYGVVEDLTTLRALLPESCSLVANSLDVGALSIFDPGAADFLAGDLQPFAAPLAFSTARLPFLVAKDALSLPGTDRTSALPHPALTTRALVTLSLWGGSGFWTWGEALHSRWQYFVRECEAVGLPLKYRRAQGFREGVFEIPHLEARQRTAIAQRVWPGVPAEPPAGGAQGDFSNSLLVCIHSRHTKSDLDELVEVLSYDRN